MNLPSLRRDLAQSCVQKRDPQLQLRHVLWVRRLKFAHIFRVDVGDLAQFNSLEKQDQSIAFLTPALRAQASLLIHPVLVTFSSPEWGGGTMALPRHYPIN